MASMQLTGKLLETSCGSPHYASPEIIRVKLFYHLQGVKYDGASADIWSCGVILYAILTGNLPFDDDNIRKLLQKVKTGIYVIPDYVPEDAADLIRKMLVVAPEKRIKIAEIEQHPWFLKRPYNWKNGGEGPLRNPPTAESLRPLTKEEASNIDVDILQSLQILGYGDNEELLKNLTSPEPNYEKVSFNLKLRCFIGFFVRKKLKHSKIMNLNLRYLKIQINHAEELAVSEVEYHFIVKNHWILILMHTILVHLHSIL